MLRKIYDWALHWADTPYGTWELFNILCMKGKVR